MGLRTDRVAAAMVGLSLSSWRRKCKGKSPVSPMLEIATTCLELLHAPPLKALEAYAEALARLRGLMPIATPPGISHQLVETLTRVGILPPSGGN